MAHITLSEKTYQFQIRFGVSTTTDDLEGEVLETSTVLPSKENIQNALCEFRGEIEQMPPVYSALKIDGMRACDRVRKGEEVTLKPRTVYIYDFTLLSMDDPNHETFEVSCSAGTYVRSLARDLAKVLGTVGCVSILRRTAVGPFNLTQAVTLEDLAKKTVEKNDNMHHIKDVHGFALPIDIGLDDILAVSVSREVADRLKNGQRVPHSLNIEALGQTIRLYEGKTFIGFAHFEAGQNTESGAGVLHPYRMINDND